MEIKKPILINTIVIMVLFTAIPLTAKEKIVSTYIIWEENKEARKYNIKIMNNDGQVVYNKVTKTTHASCELSKGKYKIKIGMIRSKHNNNVSRETKWQDFKIKTSTLLPPPKRAAYTWIESDDEGNSTARLTWKTPEYQDETTTIYKIYRRDGDEYIYVKQTGYMRIGRNYRNENKVKKYIIYKWRNADYQAIGETKRTTFYVNGLNSDIEHAFAIRSVNQAGDKSGKKDFVYSDEEIEMITDEETSTLSISSTQIKNGNSAARDVLPGLKYSIKSYYLMPAGKFSKILNPGLGGTYTVSRDSTYLRNLELGIECGYWQLSGQGSYKQTQMIPLFIRINYGFNLPLKFKLSSVIGAGGSFINLGIKNENNKGFVRPMLTGGLNIERTIAKILFINIGAEYGTLFDKSKMNSLSMFNIKLGIKI